MNKITHFTFLFSTKVVIKLKVSCCQVDGIIYGQNILISIRIRRLHLIANAHANLYTTAVGKPEERMPAYLLLCILGKSFITHSRVFPAGSAPRAFPHMLPSLRRKGPQYLIIYLSSALFTHCDHRYRSHVHVRT